MKSSLLSARVKSGYDTVHVLYSTYVQYSANMVVCSILLAICSQNWHDSVVAHRPNHSETILKGYYPLPRECLHLSYTVSLQPTLYHVPLPLL